MDTKKLENLVTKTGVGLLFFLTLVGIIFVFDTAFDLDMFSNSMKKAAGVFLGIVCVFVVCSVLVSLMLNVSRIANSIEDIANKQVEKQANEL
jgi:hypothetical protein